MSEGAVRSSCSSRRIELWAFGVFRETHYLAYVKDGMSGSYLSLSGWVTST